MNYFSKKDEMKQKAINHTRDMEVNYRPDIDFSISNTSFYDINYQYIDNKPLKYTPNVQILPMDTVSALFNTIQLYPNILQTTTIIKGNSDPILGITHIIPSAKVLLLNFASYKNPGGMFLNGSTAQEECLCHSSFLYNVLRSFDHTYYEWNRNNKNKALYLNRALYTPKISFFNNGFELKCDVLTCAAPNATAFLKYKMGKEEENILTLQSRIKFVSDIIKIQAPDIVILGAFGCGVFGQNPYDVAELFNKELILNNPNSNLNVVFAIPQGPNLDAFMQYYSAQ